MNLQLNPDIEAQARQLLAESNALHTPVPVDRVAFYLKLRVEAAELGDEVSGLLVIDHGRGTIGYNRAHAYVRQRFSVAHEIGHFMLHRALGQLFIDKTYTAVFRRDNHSSSGEHLLEVQANRFAAALLMPEELLLKELRSLEFDLGDEQALEILARKFQVSTQAMSIRLANLGFFTPDQSSEEPPLGR